MFLRCGIFVSPRRLMVRNLSVIQFPFQAHSGSLQLGPRVVWTNALLPLVRQQLHPQHTSRFIPSLSIGALKFIMITARGAGWFSFALVSRQRKRKNNLCVLCASVVNFYLFTARLPCLPNEMFTQFNEKPIYLWLHLFHRGEIRKPFHRGFARGSKLKCLK